MHTTIQLIITHLETMKKHRPFNEITVITEIQEYLRSLL